MATSGEATNRQLVKLREFSTQLAQRLKEAPNKPSSRRVSPYALVPKTT